MFWEDIWDKTFVFCRVFFLAKLRQPETTTLSLWGVWLRIYSSVQRQIMWLLSLSVCKSVPWWWLTRPRITCCGILLLCSINSQWLRGFGSLTTQTGCLHHCKRCCVCKRDKHKMLYMRLHFPMLVSSLKLIYSSCDHYLQVLRFIYHHLQMQQRVLWVSGIITAGRAEHNCCCWVHKPPGDQSGERLQLISGWGDTSHLHRCIRSQSVVVQAAASSRSYSTTHRAPCIVRPSCLHCRWMIMCALSWADSIKAAIDIKLDSCRRLFASAISVSHFCFCPTLCLHTQLS